MNILITGGASGLGEAITRTFAKDSGNKVYFTFANSAANAEAITSEFKNTVALKCDFKDDTSVDALCVEIAQKDIDVLINNAYVNYLSNTHFHKIPVSTFSEDYNYNILPVIKITQAAINQFRKKKSGKIITILTSYLNGFPPIGLSGYVANKAYLHSLVKSWANENSKFNIMSYSVSPSFLQTNLNADVDERVIEQMIADHPQKKLLTVDEVASAVLLLTNDSSQANGTDLLLNSGTGLK